MDMTAICVPTASTAAAAGVQSQSSTAKGQVSFSDFLSGLTGQGTMSSGKQTGAMTGEGLSFRGMQSRTQLDVNKVDIAELQEGDDENGLMAAIDVLLGSILEMFDSLQMQYDQGTLEAEDVDNLLNLMNELKYQLGLLGMAGQEVAGEQLAALLAQMQESQPGATGDTNTGQTLQSGTAVMLEMANADPAKLLSQMTGVPEENIEALLAKADQASPQLTQMAATDEGKQNSGQGLAQNGSGNGNMTQNNGDLVEAMGSQGETKAMQADANFLSSIRAAKEQLAGNETKTTENKTPADPNELQRNVDEGVYLQNTAYTTQGAQAEIEAEQPVLPFQTQVQQGILTGIKEGNGEFTIKLVPEGLGEMEVRLTKLAGGGMMLNIITKGDEAQRMLAAEINTLKEMLRPHQVQVESIMTEQEANLLNQQRSLEEQAWRNRRSSDSASGESGGQSGSLEGQRDEEFEETPGSARVVANGTRLDAYI